MTSDAYNPVDLAFLLSRDLDGDLSPAERLRLDEALSQSESLRSEASKLEAVDRLIQQWGQKPVEVDWKHHAALTSASAGSAADERLGKVDDLLRRWRNRSVGVEDIDLTARVLAKIRSERRRTTPYRLVLRLGVPLAAAAAIALAVTVTTWFAPARDPICRVAIGPSSWSAAVAQREIESRVVVSFARSDEVATTLLKPPAIGFATIGVEPLGSAGEEGSPL
jgi:anti-sigma factor RsiW